MQQVKIFLGLEGETTTLSDEINQWIRDSGVKIVQISGNISPQSSTNVETISPIQGAMGGSISRMPSDIFVILLYEDQ